MRTSKPRGNAPAALSRRAAYAPGPDIPLASQQPIASGRVVIAAMTIAALDMLFAALYWGTHNVSIERVLQSIAAGWLGPASYFGGSSAATVGALTHAGIAFAIVAVYAAVARRLPPRWARERWMWSGAFYGLIVYVVMNLLVVPLSRATTVPWAYTGWHLSNLVAHSVIGMICALAVLPSCGGRPEHSTHKALERHRSG